MVVPSVNQRRTNPEPGFPYNQIPHQLTFGNQSLWTLSQTFPSPATQTLCSLWLIALAKQSSSPPVSSLSLPKKPLNFILTMYGDELAYHERSSPTEALNSHPKL